MDHPIHGGGMLIHMEYQVEWMRDLDACLVCDTPRGTSRIQSYGK